ncbi:hypothetical protein [Nonomuraea sp. NPDC050786]|uniref:hypothetical protein n=1 Tax=Nonomuraea sp. NPDC050786 TaxID=3154840 RepID=UPI0033FA106B
MVALDRLPQADGRQRGMLAHRGFWIHKVPRLMLRCRLRGHRPMVDGYGPHKPGLDAARWVTCDRCGVRPDPQGSLDPEGWEVRQPYDGPYAGDEMNGPMMGALLGPGNTVIKGGMHLPGRWPTMPTGTLGGELVLGKTFGVFSAEVTIGAAGEEHTLAAHLRMWPFGVLYLHTEGFGTWLQRRLIPEGYTSRVINVSVDDWAIRWQWWAREGEWSRDDPWWMHGRISLDLVQALFGRQRRARCGPWSSAVEGRHGAGTAPHLLRREGRGAWRERATPLTAAPMAPPSRQPTPVALLVPRSTPQAASPTAPPRHRGPLSAHIAAGAIGYVQHQLSGTGTRWARWYARPASPSNSLIEIALANGDHFGLDISGSQITLWRNTDFTYNNLDTKAFTLPQRVDSAGDAGRQRYERLRGGSHLCHPGGGHSHHRALRIQRCGLQHLGRRALRQREPELHISLDRRGGLVRPGLDAR